MFQMLRGAKVTLEDRHALPLSSLPAALIGQPRRRTDLFHLFGKHLLRLIQIPRGVLGCFRGICTGRVNLKLLVRITDYRLAKSQQEWILPTSLMPLMLRSIFLT